MLKTLQKFMSKKKKKKHWKRVFETFILLREFLSFFFLSWKISSTVSVYYFPTEEEDDEDGPTFKEKMIELSLKSIDIFCIWDCCSCWLKFQEMVAWLVFDPFVELFITLCIVINTLFMALDHHNMDKGIEKILKTGNYVSFIDFFCAF